MSTKRLQRTVIEGGRHNSNKWDRRHSHADVRAKLKNYLADVMKDLEVAYEEDVEPIEPVYQGFTDKLRPMYRWLRKQAGRPWAEVRSEVFEKFDTRTTAGRHITFDHLLKSVEVTPDLTYSLLASRNRPDEFTTSYREYEFYVDDDGILREKTVLESPWKKEKVPAIDTKQLGNWLNGRIVGKVGNKLFWFTPADKNKKRGGYAKAWKTYWGYSKGGLYYDSEVKVRFQYLAYEVIYKLDSNGVKVLDHKGAPIEVERVAKWVDTGTPTLRQDRKLNEKEAQYWNTLPSWYQTKVLEDSPTYPNPPKRDYWGRRIR